MILPDKHITLEYSLLGQGGAVLRALDRPQPARALFDRVQKKSTIETFDRFLLVVTFLYTVGCLEMSDGLLRKPGR